MKNIIQQLQCENIDLILNIQTSCSCAHYALFNFIFLFTIVRAVQIDGVYLYITICRRNAYFSFNRNIMIGIIVI